MRVRVSESESCKHTGSVGAQKAQTLSGGDGQGEVVESLELPIYLFHIQQHHRGIFHHVKVIHRRSLSRYVRRLKLLLWLLL